MNLDEYVGILHTHQLSYWRFMQEHLFAWVDIEPQNIFVPAGWPDEEDGLQAECKALEQFIVKHGPVDIWVAGIGVDGHIGFCEAGTSFDSRTFVVDLAPSTIKANELEDTGIAQAITAGLGTIMESECILQLANGPKKAWAIERTILGPVNVEVPSSVCQKHANHILIVDIEAAAGILEHIKEHNIPEKDGHFTVFSEAGIEHQVVLEN